MKQLISIVLPVFNVEKYIAKSIQSVLNQTYTNFELLIINDGTQDKSIEVAAKFRDSRIRIFNKANGGVSDARNFGMSHANGDYLYFLDSDDWIEPELLQICIESISKYESDFIIFSYHLDREDITGGLVSTTEISHETIVFNKKHKNLFFDRNTLGLLGYTWNKFYKASFIRDNKVKFDKEVSLFEDVLFNCKAYELSDKIVFIKNVLYHYIDRPSASLIKTFHINSFELNVKKNKAINCFLNEWNVNEELKNKVLSEGVVTGIRYCFNNLFAYKNDLNFIKKINYIKMIVNHDETKKYIKFYETKSVKDRIYKTLISSQTVGVLYLLFKITK